MITALKVIWAIVFLATVVGTILLLVYGLYMPAVCLGALAALFGVMVVRDVVQRIRGGS